MIKKIFFLFFNIIEKLDKILRILTKKSFLIWFKDFIQEKSYKSVHILNKEVKFFVPNQLLEWRVNTCLTKEPETIEWIDGFENKENLIFWDIGANIGLYSIYNSLKNVNSTTIAFEPSSSNLRVLTRNISINNLENNIKVVPIPLTNKQNMFQLMNESNFMEGGALNSFGDSIDAEGKEFKANMKYTLFGTTMNYFIENSILDIPDYIKIDVDGIEHLILAGGSKFLKDKKIKSLLIEINENFKEQSENIFNLMKEYEFKILHKKRNDAFYKDKFANTYNFIFTR